ncbi:glycosyltransferase family 25 protein [Aquitalea sp. S1-19]|nr:glycosyltransferase family 25 protein [Aquitalea sp. S1-19]
MKLTDLVERIYVINLPERTDRRRQLGAELRRHGLNWCAGQIICWPAQRPVDAQGFPTPGTRGCFLSHLAALEDASELNSGYVLVLEDDAALLPTLPAALEELALVLANERPELLYLGHCRQEGVAHPLGPSFQPCLNAIEGAHAYLVDVQLLPALLAYLRDCLTRPPGHPDGGCLHYDAALTLFRRRTPNCKTWIATPALIEQRYSRSDIQPSWWYDRWPIFRTLVASLRKIKQIRRHACP